eukprot:TRINITY_DN26549_c0_g1_i1.p2 TRINITY_DN26549_c0_g1~~TRINITY_DN26549_c0_g1_i1.p2  ORF type:complete len:296 (+),score=46.79 TRINITY_DN26549_c0_g1_i1:181-1068(+)
MHQEDDNGSNKSFVNILNSLSNALIAGSVSGLSRLVTHPTDTIKARIQVEGLLSPNSSVYSSSLFRACRNIWRREGFFGFYSGFGAVVLGIIPANSAYYCGHALGKEVSGEGGFWSDAATGIVAQALAGLVFTPIDVAKERLQVQPMKGQTSAKYRGAIDAFYSLYREGALLRGYWVTNSVWFPWNVIYMSTYEGLKRQVNGEGNQDMTPLQYAVCSGISATIAVILTHPMDIIKTRYQVINSKEGDSIVGVVQQTIKSEGFGVLHKGLIARILTIAPGSAISWMIYESVKKFLN